MSFNKSKYVKPSDLFGYPYERLDRLIVEAKCIVQELLCKSAKNIIAYSGGKDCIVISDICKDVIKDGICDSSFHFKTSIEDIEKSVEHFGLNVTYDNSWENWDWLKLNQKYCACPPKLQSDIYRMRQQNTVKKFAKKNKYTGIVYGRRTEENTVRKSLYALSNGQWQCHPLRDWTTNDIWAYIYRHQLPYPRLYHHEVGQKEGFTPYLLIPESFKNNCVWAPIYDIEPAVVEKFATFHEPAKRWLNSTK